MVINMHSEFEMKSYKGQMVKGNKWIIDDTVKKSVVIMHGMNEYSFRYNDFAFFLNSNGYDVFALDHLGHGLNVDDPKDLLKWPKDGFIQCVENAYCLIEKLKEEGREVIVFAHSMGSFMGQCLIERHPGVVNKIILCGTSGPQPLIQKLGGMIARIVGTFTLDGKKPSKFMDHLCFSSYNNKIKNKRTKFDWLSVNKQNVDKYINDPYCGAIPSKNFFYSFVGNISKIFKRKNINRIDSNTHVLFIVGQDDPVGNYVKSIKKLQSLYIKRKISSSLISYENMRHEILNEDKKEQVYLDVLTFLNEKCS